MFILLILSFVFLIVIVFSHSEAWGISIENIQNPRESKQWVVDTAKVWNQETESQLEGTLADLSLKNETEFVIVTVPGIPEGTDLRSMAKTLRQNFRVGKPEFDNGILLLISKRPEKIISLVSKGFGIPNYYFYTDVIDGKKIETIQQWLPLEIQGLSEVSYRSQPEFRQIYQTAGWLGFGLATAGFFGFESLTYHLTSRKNCAHLKMTGSTGSLVNSIHFIQASVFSIRLGKTIGAISLSTFFLSRSPISGGLNTGSSDFLWIILAGLSVLPIHIIPDLWLRSRARKANILSVSAESYDIRLIGTVLLQIMPFMLLGIFQKAAYSNTYKHFSHIGTSPILEFVLIFFGILISGCLLPFVGVDLTDPPPSLKSPSAHPSKL